PGRGAAGAGDIVVAGAGARAGSTRGPGGDHAGVSAVGVTAGMGGRAARGLRRRARRSPRSGRAQGDGLPGDHQAGAAHLPEPVRGRCRPVDRAKRRSYDPVLGYSGAETSIYPTLSDEATRKEMLGKLSMAAPGSVAWPVRQEAAEVAWL